MKPITTSTGLHFQAGTQISYMTDAVNLDPNRWSDPEEFDCLRFYKLKQDVKTDSQQVTLNYSYSGFVVVLPFTFFLLFLELELIQRPIKIARGSSTSATACRRAADATTRDGSSRWCSPSW